MNNLFFAIFMLKKQKIPHLNQICIQSDDLSRLVASELFTLSEVGSFTTKFWRTTDGPTSMRFPFIGQLQHHGTNQYLHALLNDQHKPEYLFAHRLALRNESSIDLFAGKIFRVSKSYVRSFEDPLSFVAEQIETNCARLFNQISVKVSLIQAELGDEDKSHKQNGSYSCQNRFSY
jgi:hypothetical protein